MWIPERGETARGMLSTTNETIRWDERRRTFKPSFTCKDSEQLSDLGRQVTGRGKDLEGRQLDLAQAKEVVRDAFDEQGGFRDVVERLDVLVQQVDEFRGRLEGLRGLERCCELVAEERQVGSAQTG